LSDIEQDPNEGEDIANDGKEEPEAENMDTQEDRDMGDNMDVIDLNEGDQEDGEKNQEAGGDDEADPGQKQARASASPLEEISDDILIQAMVIELSFFQGWTQSEIAE